MEPLPPPGGPDPYAQGEMQEMAGGAPAGIPPELLQMFGAMGGPEDPAAIAAELGQQIGTEATMAHEQVDQMATQEHEGIDAETQQLLDMIMQIMEQSAVMASSMGPPGVTEGMAGGAPFAAPAPAPAGDAGIDLAGLLAGGGGGPMPIDPAMAAQQLDPAMLGQG